MITRREAMKLFLSNLLTMTIFAQSGRADNRKYIYNPGLSNVTSGFKGNIIIDDVFQNLYGQSGGSSLWQVLKWRFSENEVIVIGPDLTY